MRQAHPVGGFARRSSPFRARAQERLRTQSAVRIPRAPEELQRLLHELQVHQIELEMQNEELRNTQKELEASRAKYLNLYDLAPVAYVILSEQGLILEVNLAAAKLLGVERSRLVQQPVTRFIVREDRDLYHRYRRQLFETGAPLACELRMRRPGGAPAWVRIDAQVARDNKAGPPLARVGLSDITERKRAEADRERLAHVMKSANDTVLLTDETGRILEANDRAMEIYGYSLAELRQKSVVDLRTPASRAEYPQQIEQLNISGRAVFEAVHQRRDGVAFPVEISHCSSTIRGVRYRLAIVRDITRRKRAEEKRQESEQQYRLLFSEMLAGCALHEIICDEQGRPCDYRFLEVNPAFERLTGLTRERVVGHTVREVIPDIEPRWIEIYGKVALTGESAHFTHYSGALGKHFQVSAFRTRPSQFAVTFHDITDRKRAEEAVRQSEARLAALINEAPDSIIVVDENQRIQIFNHGAEMTFGYRAEEALGRPLDLLLPARSVEPHRQHIRDFAAAPEAARRIDGRRGLCGRRKDGCEFPAEITISKHTEQGRTLFTAILRDITKRKRAEQELRGLSTRLLHAQEEERRQIGKELHDAVGQELAAALMTLGIVKKRVEHGNKETFKLVADGLAVLEQSAQDIRNLSHLLHPPFLEEVGLSGALRQHAAVFRRHRRMAVNTEVPKTWARLAGDVELALFRIAQEALNNASRHSGSHSATVRLQRADDTVTLEIADTGRGLSAARSAGDDLGGIGIANMRERLRHFGGKLEIETSKHGTTVRASVPVGGGGMVHELSKPALPSNITHENPDCR